MRVSMDSPDGRLNLGIDQNSGAVSGLPPVMSCTAGRTLNQKPFLCFTIQFLECGHRAGGPDWIWADRKTGIDRVYTARHWESHLCCRTGLGFAIHHGRGLLLTSRQSSRQLDQYTNKLDQSSLSKGKVIQTVANPFSNSSTNGDPVQPGYASANRPEMTPKNQRLLSTPIALCHF